MVIGAQNQDFRTIPFLWPAPEGCRTLDLGCGTGLYTHELARQNADVIGMDLDLTSVRQTKLSAGNRRIRWIRADAAHLPFKTAVFDLVVSVEVLTHLPSEVRDRVFAEIGRVTRVRGAVFISLHNRTRLSMSRWLRLQRSRGMYDTSHLGVWPTSPEEAEMVALSHGMERVTRTRYLNFHSRFTHRFSRKHPILSRTVAAIEDVLSRLPLIRRLGITFLLTLSKVEDQ